MHEIKKKGNRHPIVACRLTPVGAHEATTRVRHQRTEATKSIHGAERDKRLDEKKKKRKKYGQEKGIEGTNPRTVGSEQRKDAQTPSTTPGCIGAPRGCRRAQAAPPDAGGTHTTH